MGSELDGMVNNQRLKKRLILISVVVNVLLMLAKFSAYYFTSSNAILTDALESIINVFASGFALYSVYLASQPKDKNHPYGHGKIEFFSAGFEGALIILAGIFIIYESIKNIFNPAEINNLPIGIIIISVTIVANGILGYSLKKEGKKEDSLTLIADGKHLLTDAASSFLMVIGITIMYFTQFYFLDSILSLLFAVFILYNGYQLTRKSVAGLMDENDPVAMKKIVDVINKNRRRNWIDIHNMRIQKYGADLHVDSHITIPYYFELTEVHKEIDLLETVLKEGFKNNIEIFTHADPCIPGPCCKYCQVKNCPVRQNPCIKEIQWNSENLANNQKHFQMLIEEERVLK